MALKPGSPRQMCHVHLTGTRMPFLHLGNLGDMRLDFAAQLLQVLLAMWKPRNVWCCLKEDMDQRFAQLLLFFFCEVELRGGLNSEPALRRKACFPEVASRIGWKCPRKCIHFVQLPRSKGAADWCTRELFCFGLAKRTKMVRLSRRQLIKPQAKRGFS